MKTKDNAMAPIDSNGASAKEATTRMEITSDCVDGEESRQHERLLGGDDDATVATAQHSLHGHHVSNEQRAEWALETISTIDPAHRILRNRTSRSTLFSDDDDEEEDEDNNDGVSSAASFSSIRGLENISVASDVILPLRYSYQSYLPVDCRHTDSSPADGPSIDPEKFTTGQLDVTSDTSASSTPSSSQSDRSSRETMSKDDNDRDGADDADSDVTVADAASQLIDYAIDSDDDDDDLESKASSSRFTPDEFWDWLDNVQVAFIQVDNNNLPRKLKSRISSAAVPSKLADVSSVRTEDLSFSDPMPASDSCNLNEGCLAEEEDDPLASDLHHGESYVCSSQKHVPLLKHSASVADFRPHAEQVHQPSQTDLRRTVSFADMTVEPPATPSEPFDDCATRMRRISSNEHLLLTLHRSKKPHVSTEVDTIDDIHAGLVMSHAQGLADSGTLVCYDPSGARPMRRLVLFLSSIFILAFTASKLASFNYEDIPGTCKPRTLTIDLDSTFMPPFESVSVTLETSASAVVEVLKGKLPESIEDLNAILAESKLSAAELYYYLKDHLSSGQEMIKPRIVAIDVQKYASVAYQEASELMKSSWAGLGDQGLSLSLDQLQSTLSRAQKVLIQHLSDLCRSSSIDGPKEALFGACDALYERMPSTYAPVEGEMDLGPPQLVVDREFVQKSFDAMANETLAYIARFAAAIHDICTELRSHCQSIPLPSLSSGNVVPAMNEQCMTDTTHPGFLAAAMVPRFATHVELFEQGVEPVNDSAHLFEHAAAFAAPEDGSNESESPSLRMNTKIESDTIEGDGRVALSQRVHDILSHLDAKGRLDELESLLVEKFGPDFVDPPLSINFEATEYLGGWVPLLGKERDRHLHKQWLNLLERQVVESTLQGDVRPSQSGSFWASVFIGRAQSIFSANHNRETVDG